MLSFTYPNNLCLNKTTSKTSWTESVFGIIIVIAITAVYVKTSTGLVEACVNIPITYRFIKFTQNVRTHNSKRTKRVFTSLRRNLRHRQPKVGRNTMLWQSPPFPNSSLTSSVFTDAFHQAVLLGHAVLVQELALARASRASGHKPWASQSRDAQNERMSRGNRKSGGGQLEEMWLVNWEFCNGDVIRENSETASEWVSERAREKEMLTQSLWLTSVAWIFHIAALNGNSGSFVCSAH